MMPGTIKTAEREGVHVIKMEGDVRLTLCLAFDEYIEDMLDSPGYDSVIFDLTRAHAIDSTTLGLMAKFSIKSAQHGQESPIVVSNNPSITRILVSMGFDDIFRIVDREKFYTPLTADNDDIAIVAEQNGKEMEIQKKVLEAHHFLMDMNEQNRSTFEELMESLEKTR